MSPGFYKFLADALVVFHISFVGFVLFGATIVLRWRRAMWLHLPAVAWGIFVELSHHICPLTPLENRLRSWGGTATYQGGFVNHYIMPVLYPRGLTHGMQVALAIVILVLNCAAYGWLIASRRNREPVAPEPVGVSEVPAKGPASNAGEDAGVPALAASQFHDVR
jgi:hypothetical protein